MKEITSLDSLRTYLCTLYHDFGYTPFKVSKFEEYDLYAQHKNFLACKKVLTFSDTDGKLLALKPDVTLSVIRNTPEDEPINKIYYNENVYRIPDGSSSFQEIPQTGLECIGDIDSYDIAEVIMLAAKSLSMIDNKFILDLSHVGVILGILEHEKLDEEVQKQFIAAIGSKNSHLLGLLCKEFNVSASSSDALIKLSSLYGSAKETYKIAASLELPDESAKCMEDLGKIIDLLSIYELDNINLDFSGVNDIEYYNGIVFQGFINGVASSVLAGGQYDNLIKNLNRKGGAIGFAVYFDALESIINTSRDYDVDTVIIYNDEADIPEAIKLAKQCGKDGISVRIQSSKPTNITYKQLLNISEGGK